MKRILELGKGSPNSMQKKYIFRQLQTLLCTVFSVSVLIFVVCAEISVFHFVLYQRRKYINVDMIITQNLLPKLIFGTILIVLGIFCYVFYLSVLRENMLLIVVRFLFYSAGFISCLWEYETQFYISSYERVIWIKCEDILFLLLQYTFLELLRAESKQPSLNRLFQIYQIVLVSFVGCMLFSVTKTNFKFDIIFAIYSWLLCLIYIFKMTKSKEKFTYAVFFVAYFIVMGMFFQMRTSDNLFRDQHKILLLAYLSLIVAVLIYLYYYQRFHLRMCLSKDINQKIKFANKYKYEITNKLIEAVETPINSIEGLNEILAEYDEYTSGKSGNILEAMNYEIKKVKKSLGYLKNNSLLVENAYNIEKIKVNFDLILRETLEAIEGKSEYAGRCVFVNRLKTDNFINCDPYYLIDAVINIIQELLELCTSDSQVLVSIQNDESEQIQMNMQVSYNQDERRKVIQFYHLFKRRVFQQNTYKEDNISLLSARNIILLHSGTFSVEKDSRVIKLCCCFPPCKKIKADKTVDETINVEENVKEEQIIVLISNKAEQIALVSSYLSMEPFHLQVFSTGVEAVDYINKTPNVVLVLIGDVFFNMAYFEVSSEIRKNFSLAQLTIVLLSSKKARHINDSHLKDFNDILEEPFSRREFLLKVYGAVRLRQSEDELSKYRIDFLQSQMNPHFIFNTISSIMPLCLNSPMEAYSLLEYFAEYLRGNLYAGNLHSHVPLQREIDLIDAFLSIEKIRFKGLIESSIYLDCDSNVPILPLMIEPLVENCVVHARVSGEILQISVSIVQEESGLFVEVEDNGAGMSEENIEDIYQMNNTNSFGLSNVIKRLRLYYQEELSIVSEIGKGTKISFYIPGQNGQRKKEN